MKKFTYGETVHICAEKAKEFKKEFWKDMFEYGVDTNKLESITQSLKTLCDNYMHAEAFDVVVSFNWFTSDVVDDFEYFCTDNALKSIFMEIILEEVEDIIEELIMEEYEFIMPIVYSILIAVLGLDFFKNNIFIVSVFLFFTIALILLAVWGVITDFKKSMLLEILTMIKNSGKIYEAIE